MSFRNKINNLPWEPVLGCQFQKGGRHMYMWVDRILLQSLIPLYVGVDNILNSQRYNQAERNTCNSFLLPHNRVFSKSDDANSRT